MTSPDVRVDPGEVSDLDLRVKIFERAVKGESLESIGAAYGLTADEVTAIIREMGVPREGWVEFCPNGD